MAPESSSPRPVSRPRRHRIAVFSRPDPSGARLIPLRFTWRAQEYVIESTGRYWTDLHGQHTLVMTAQGRMFELVYRPTEDEWYMLKASTASTATFS